MRPVSGFLASLAVFIATALAACRMDMPSDLPLERARAVWPDAFVPGKVAVIDYHGQLHYAFAGEAEDYFPGEGLETEAELHEEAVLDAKTRFYGVMSGGDPSRLVGLSGTFVPYQWVEGPMRYVVCMVPVSAVRLMDGGAAETLSPPGESPPAKD
jgi:hypothetical protein